MATSSQVSWEFSFWKSTSTFMSHSQGFKNFIAVQYKEAETNRFYRFQTQGKSNQKIVFQNPF